VVKRKYLLKKSIKSETKYIVNILFYNKSILILFS